jgi:hypothetical protein
LIPILLLAGFLSAAADATPPPAPVPDLAPAPACTLQVLPPLRIPPGRSAFAPQALAVDGLGRLFVLDRAGGRIARLLQTGEWLEFGVGDQGGGRYPNLTRLFAQWGPDLFALDSAAEILDQFDLDGHLKKSISYHDGLVRAELGFVQIADFGLTRAGELLLIDRAGGRLLLFDRFGGFLTDLAAGASGAARPQSPTRLAQDQDGQIFLLDPSGSWIRRFTRQGTSRPAWRYARPESTGTGEALLAAAPWGQIVVAGRDGRWARFFNPDGRLELEFRNPAPPGATLTDLEAGPDSVLYLACPSLAEIERWRWIARGARPADRR